MIMYNPEAEPDVDVMIATDRHTDYQTLNRMEVILAVMLTLTRTIVTDTKVNNTLGITSEFGYLKVIQVARGIVDNARREYKDARRYKTHDVTSICTKVMETTIGSDGGQHKEVQLFMLSFLVYLLSAHLRYLSCKFNNDISQVVDTVRNVQAYCDKTYKEVETKFCSELNIDRFDKVIEVNIGMNIDKIYEYILNEIERNKYYQ